MKDMVSWLVSHLGTSPSIKFKKITPAILAGNTVVVQPPTNTPLTALIYAEIIHESGLPKGVFNLVTGKGSVIGDYLADHPDVDAISFAGSTGSRPKNDGKSKPGIKASGIGTGRKISSYLS